MDVGRPVFSQDDQATPAPVEGEVNCLIAPFIRVSVRILVEAQLYLQKAGISF